MSLSVVLVAVIVVVTVGVGVLGAVRIGKDRPLLKSYDPAKSSSDMGSRRADARTRLKTDSETPSSLDPSSGESHLRARLEIEEHQQQQQQPDAQVAVVKRVCWMLFQLTGIPLLTGYGTSATQSTATTMGNTAKPTLAVHDLSLDNNSVEMDPLRDSKTPITAAAEQQELDDHDPQWSDASESESESEMESEASSTAEESEQEAEDKATALRSEIMMDGLQFYTAVAQLSVSTVHSVLDIGLFRATTIVMRERRKALEDASILAIEESYPDIMCLPGFANARYATQPTMKKKLDVSEKEDMSCARVTSPRTQVQLETGFLKAA